MEGSYKIYTQNKYQISTRSMVMLSKSIVMYIYYITLGSCNSYKHNPNLSPVTNPWAAVRIGD